MTPIKKLKEHNIFKPNSIVQSTITKDWMGSPVDVQAHLIVKQMNVDDVICEEYNESDGKTYKIKFIDITTIDGMDPLELAAVYGLAPKTERFRRRQLK
jgi:hypothetical protein